MKKLTMLLVCVLFFGLSTQLVAQNIQQSIDQQIVQLLENNSITTQDTQWTMTSQHTSRVSGITHVYYRQILNGVEIYGTESSIHLYADGSVLKSNIQFIDNINAKATVGATPSLTAVQAVQSAANFFNYGSASNVSVLHSENNTTQKTTLSGGSVSLSPIPAQLVYQLNANDELVLAWDLSIEEVAQENWWSVRVDATSGAIVDQNNLMSSCNFEHDHSTHETNFNKNLYDIPNYKEAMAQRDALNEADVLVDSYEVFAMPIESPYYGARTIEVTPAFPLASPFGWHDTDGIAGAEFTVTQGNNTNTYEDGDNAGYQAEGGAQLEFTGFPFDQNYTNSNQYEDAALTNLFYWSNIIHDVMYVYGFDEASGNFQENNYGNGGSGSDSVNSEAQDGSGTCNANFGTPADGSNPRMQMYVCGNKDGDFDNLVIVHEYGHGISNRLTGGGNNTGCLGNQEQMGEGWSDWYGVVMTIEPGDLGTDGRAVGTYLFGQGAGGAGIRPFPYNTDIAQNPQTYDDIKTAAVPHGVGSVWATTLWEVTWALIDEHGWDPNIYNFTGDVNLDAGNVMAMALVTEGLKLQPCGPGFVDGRDAIFAADIAIYGGANECLLWDAFAKRGLGVSADQGSSGSRSDGTEAFDTPTGLAEFTAPGEFCANDLEATGLGGGTPFGGTYSGPGVTDDGNGSTYSFDPVAAGIGVHTITYDVPTGTCSTASSDSDTVEVVAVPDSPTAMGVSDFCVGDSVTVTATLADPANVISWYDDATGGTLLATGSSYTFVPTGSMSVWAEETPPGPASQLKISEITLQADKFEIQNVGLAADYTGYTVAVSDQPYGDINAVNSVTKTLGAMGADQSIFWDEVPGSSQEWGVNIFWNDGSPGWILIIDDVGDVVDSVFWNTGASEIAGFNVTINGFNVTGADLDWTGPGADFGSTCDDSYRRNNDSDDAVNWAAGCQTSDYGVPNADINLGYQGCVGDRAEAVLTADAEPPTITCPADVTLDAAAGECSVPNASIGTPTTTDNCGGEVATNDAPADIPVGVTTVTWTVTDTSGNMVTCTQVVTVVDSEDPTLTCPADLEVDVNEGELFTLPDYTGDAVAADNCTNVTLTQDPVAGTQVGVGATVVTITATDDASNSVTCIFTVTVNELVLGVEDTIFSTEIVLFPNPTSGQLTLVNNSNEVLKNITITDVNGRTIQTITIPNGMTETTFSLDALSQGMYFVRIDGENVSTIKQIVKQ